MPPRTPRPGNWRHCCNSTAPSSPKPPPWCNGCWPWKPSGTHPPARHTLRPQAASPQPGTSLQTPLRFARQQAVPTQLVADVQHGAVLIVMLGGGDKATQTADIAKAVRLAATLED